MGRAIGLNEPVVVSSNGKVRWLTPTILDGFCKQHVRFFPFDDQYCPLKFYSWNYDVMKLMLTGNDADMLSNYTGKFMDLRFIDRVRLVQVSSCGNTVSMRRTTGLKTCISL
jgi:hypothetical protein